MSPDDRVVAVVGGGITGLSAAHRLLSAGPAGAGPGPIASPPRVIVVEADDRLGGKIRTEAIGGRPVEAGPDAFLSGSGEGARGEALALCRELGLSEQLISPATGRASILLWGRLHPIPPGQVLGVPTSLAALRALGRVGLISPLGVARGSLDLVLPRRVGDDEAETAGELVGHRLGTEVLSHVVNPLVGGIHAGNAGHLSAEAVTPQLLAAARSHRGLMRGLGAAPSGRPRQGFYSLAGGLSLLVDRLADAIRNGGGELWTGAPVLALSRQDGRWRLELGSGREVIADAVVLAVPAFSAAALLEPHDRSLSALLGTIDYASVSLVTSTYPEESVAHPLDQAGFLVSAARSRLRPTAPVPLLTACTFTTSKWPQTKRPGQVVLRASTGRSGDDRALQMTDDELTAAVHAELAPLLGLSAPPTETVVHRWPRSFPQYRAGHLQTLARLEERAGRLPGLVLAGAAYRGLGIPACLAQGQEAAGVVTA
ncbi:MAG: protoporphyrinogen oxidase, partial [Acidimicrobiales bacterium]|nr:protoporphyrinogen oxidase [Acidimicrobiales bacterium]